MQIEKDKNWIFLTWEHHRRTIELSKAFNINLFILESSLSKPFKYIPLLYKTFILLSRRRPKGIIVQNPSIVLAFFTVTFKNILKFKIIVDTHNAGLIPTSKLLYKISSIYRYIQRKSDLIIITNDNLKQVVEKNGGKAFVLPDKIPELERKPVRSLNGKINIAYICSFSPDEPYREVIKAASFIPNNIRIYVTGDYHKISSSSKLSVPDNVTLCGFLDDNEYETLLRSSDIIITLTDREDCLVCGAYEAVALNKPMILSDTYALKKYFNLGVVYTKNNAKYIANAILEATQEKTKLEDTLSKLRNNLEQDWIKRSQILMEMMNDWNQSC